MKKANGTASACLLIVDDNAELGASLVTLFQRGGYIAASARSGHRALDYLMQKRIEIVFTDIFMPKGDGLDLLRELYQRNIYPRIVAIASGEDTGVPDMLPAVMEEVHTIQKPFETGKLLQLVRELIDKPACSA